jgi:hypothetical protein
VSAALGIQVKADWPGRPGVVDMTEVRSPGMIAAVNAVADWARRRLADSAATAHREDLDTMRMWAKLAGDLEPEVADALAIAHLSVVEQALDEDDDLIEASALLAVVWSAWLCLDVATRAHALALGDRLLTAL